MCYMNAVFQFLSYSYQDIKPPRILNDEILKEENYGKLRYPDLNEKLPTNMIKTVEIEKNHETCNSLPGTLQWVFYEDFQ